MVSEIRSSYHARENAQYWQKTWHCDWLLSSQIIIHLDALLQEVKFCQAAVNLAIYRLNREPCGFMARSRRLNSLFTCLHRRPFSSGRNRGLWSRLKEKEIVLGAEKAGSVGSEIKISKAELGVTIYHSSSRLNWEVSFAILYLLFLESIALQNYFAFVGITLGTLVFLGMCNNQMDGER